MDPCIHGEEPLDQKNADGRTAFQLYIVDLECGIDSELPCSPKFAIAKTGMPFRPEPIMPA